MKNKAKRYTLLSFAFAFSVLVSGCSQKDENLDFDKPKFQIPKKQKVVNQKKGSLFSKKGASLFADKKDLQIGDIIQINIDEEVQADSKNSRDLSQSNDASLGGGLLSAGNGVTNTPGTANRIEKFNNALGTGFTTSSSSSFSGSADTKFDESFNTSISAIIEQTYQNGNYYIKGSKEIMIDGQMQEIVIAGVIRPYDITPDNAINSSQIANLKILYKRAGDDQRSLEKSWGTKLLETIWPF